MKDRIPLYPGRVKLEPVVGQTGLYDMTRADEPTEPGTLLSKATLLADDTAALYGLTGDDATVNKALAKGNRDTAGIWDNAQNDEDVYLYTWQATAYSSEEKAPETGSVALCQGSSGGDSATWEYGDAYTLDPQGQFHIVDPKTITVKCGSYSSSYNVVRGKWGKPTYTTNCVYYIAPDAVGQGWSEGSDDNDNKYYYMGYPLFASANNYHNKIVGRVVTQTPLSPVTSYDIDAYPDGGFSDDGSIYYSGRSQTAAAKILMAQSGTYIGTGTYGQNNLNSITFDKKPKLVFVGAPDARYSFVLLQGVSGNVGYNVVYPTWNGKTVSWYASNAAQQCNTKGATYTYYYIY